MEDKIIKFGMYLTGRNKSTIKQMYEDWLKKYPFVWKVDKKKIKYVLNDQKLTKQNES